MLVYFHRNPITYDIFYVGIGSENTRYKRENSKTNRNKYWSNYVNKYGGKFIVQVVCRGLSTYQATEKERYYITLLGKRINGGQLVNLADGGETNAGCKKNIFQRMRLSDVAKQQKRQRQLMTPEARAKAIPKISASLKGKLIGDKNPNYGNRWTDEMKKYMSSKKTGVRLTEEQKKIKAYKQILTARNFVFDQSLNCTFLSIKFVADYYNHSAQYVGSMLDGKRPNKLSIHRVELRDSA